MALVKDPSIYKTFRKKSTVDTVELEIGDKKQNKIKKESTAECQKNIYHCSFKGCLGIIYNLIYSFSYM